MMSFLQQKLLECALNAEVFLTTIQAACYAEAADLVNADKKLI
jgi:hypothetical protein